jgi:hypothetical protein
VLEIVRKMMDGLNREIDDFFEFNGTCYTPLVHGVVMEIWYIPAGNERS